VPELITGGLGDPTDRGVVDPSDHVANRIGVVLNDGPSNIVERSELDRCPVIVIDLNEISALRARLANVPTLQVTGENNRRICFSNGLPLVNVAQRPVIVTVIGQLLWRAGRVAIVSFHVHKRRMQKADIEIT